MQRVESITLVIKYIYCVMATSVHNIINSVKLKIYLICLIFKCNVCMQFRMLAIKLAKIFRF